jgi:hypothetical protein
VAQVVHGNIKARNVLLSRELDTAKLSTSGLAHLLGKRTAPRSAAGDVAAFGNCLWLVRLPICTMSADLPAACAVRGIVSPSFGVLHYASAA